MDEIELVVKIPAEVYRYAKKYNGSSMLTLREEEMGMCMNAIANGTPLPKGHGRLIDADAFADKIKEVSIRHRYEDLKLNRICTVADVLNAVTHDLKGTALNGYELCPTVIEANKGE